jgi:hypothetical protein
MAAIERRDVLKGMSAAALRAVLPFPLPSGKLVGIQVGAVSFVDEGNAILDRFQEAGVNALFLATFTYGRGIAGRQVPGQPFPDHGKRESDEGTFRGGNYARVHAQYYRDTSLRAIRAPDFGDLDILERVLPEARKRAMKVYCWYEDVFARDVPGIDRLQETNLSGNKASTLCFHNPDTLAFWLALTEDYVRSYGIDGVMWGSERQGPFGNALGASHGGRGSDPRNVTCFCDFCRRSGREAGIDFDRAREGYTRLAELVARSRKSDRPPDGFFVSFWRLIVQYPEILAWEKLWNDGLKGTYAAIYRLVKSIHPETGVGWHVWHNNSFSPFYRAEQDYGEFARYSDYLKVVAYNNCGGPRLATYVESVAKTLFADFPAEEVLRLTYRIQNYDERPLGDLPKTGLSADYVYRETRRALAGVGSKVQIYPGIDIDIPTGAAEKKTEPREVREAVKAAFRAGAQGVILSRKYSEMKLANLAAAREGID